MNCQVEKIILMFRNPRTEDQDIRNNVKMFSHWYEWTGLKKHVFRVRTGQMATEIGNGYLIPVQKARSAWCELCSQCFALATLVVLGA